VYIYKTGTEWENNETRGRALERNVREWKRYTIIYISLFSSSTFSRLILFSFYHLKKYFIAIIKRHVSNIRLHCRVWMYTAGDEMREQKYELKEWKINYEILINWERTSRKKANEEMSLKIKREHFKKLLPSIKNPTL
jgi:hypothetical protein